MLHVEHPVVTVPRPPGVDGGRPHRVTIRLSGVERNNLELLRGTLNESEWFRMALAKATVHMIETRPKK